MIKLCHGKNSFLSYKQAQKEIVKLEDDISKNDSAYDKKILDATSASADEIINEIETPSLFTQNKILLIKRLSDNSDKTQLRDFFIELNNEDKDSFEVNVVIWETEKIRGNTNYLKSFAKKDIYESPKLNKRTFKTWAKKQLNEAEIQLNNPALNLLSKRTNYDPERFLQEIKKIKLSPEKEINEELINKLCPDTLEHTVWELIDYINAGNSKKAAQNLQIIVQQGNDPFFVLLMIVRNLRLIFLTKRYLDQGISLGQIASKTKSPPFVIKKIKKTAYNTSYSQIKKLYQKLCNIDYCGKTGQLDVQLALDILLSVI